MIAGVVVETITSFTERRINGVIVALQLMQLRIPKILSLKISIFTKRYLVLHLVSKSNAFSATVKASFAKYVKKDIGL